ncbi:Rod shape-determining protein MreD [Balamuthia mandrillaris]
MHAYAKLILSLLIDAVGVITYLIPGLGEVADAAWAPISAFLLWYLYGSLAVAALGFVEEAIPGTDFVPTATLAWLNERYGWFGSSSTRQQQQGGWRRAAPRT